MLDIYTLSYAQRSQVTQHSPMTFETYCTYTLFNNSIPWSFILTINMMLHSNIFNLKVSQSVTLAICTTWLLYAVYIAIYRECAGVVGSQQSAQLVLCLLVRGLQLSYVHTLIHLLYMCAYTNEGLQHLHTLHLQIPWQVLSPACENRSTPLLEDLRMCNGKHAHMQRHHDPTMSLFFFTGNMSSHIFLMGDLQLVMRFSLDL